MVAGCDVFWLESCKSLPYIAFIAQLMFLHTRCEAAKTNIFDIKNNLSKRCFRAMAR